MLLDFLLLVLTIEDVYHKVVADKVELFLGHQRRGHGVITIMGVFYVSIDVLRLLGNVTTLRS